MMYSIRELKQDEVKLLDTFLYEAIFVPEGIVAPSKNIINQPELQVYVRNFGENKGDFQKWYDGQSRYRTKDDKKRDAEMEAATLTMPEMARQLGITRNQVYGILNSQKYQHFFEFVTIADRKRITKESFQKFLDGQDEYHLDPANDYEELAMEENVALANYRRKKLAQTGERGRNGNLQYLTIDEAAFMAKVSRSMINVWYTKGYFPVVKIRNHVRIKRKEFEAWLEKRNTERGC